MRFAAAIVLVACGLLAVLITSAGNPAPASAAPSPPTATTGTASNQAQSSATVSGTVNPNGTDTSYFFQYGTTTAYGPTRPRRAPAPVAPTSQRRPT